MGAVLQNYLSHFTCGNKESGLRVQFLICSALHRYHIIRRESKSLLMCLSLVDVKFFIPTTDGNLPHSLWFCIIDQQSRYTLCGCRGSIFSHQEDEKRSQTGSSQQRGGKEDSSLSGMLS